MKTLRIFSFLVLSLNVALAQGEKTFLGAIPAQYVAPGKEVVLDMHRFYQPGAKSKLDFGTKNHVDLAFDARVFNCTLAQRRAVSPTLFSQRPASGENAPSLAS